MNRRKFLSHSAVALSAGSSVLGAARSRANRPDCNYRIVYNDDGHTLQRVSGVGELLEKGVDRFIGTQVDALFWSVGEADVFYFRTRTAEMYGENLKRFQSAGGLRFIQGLESVLKEREDYFQAMADRCRQIGIQFFVTVRMNDAHDSPKGWNAVDLYSQYKRAHPELLLGDAVHPSFATGFDFAYEQVRQNKFKVIEEIVQDYDLDGIELDFLRHPAFFKPDEAFRNRHLITQLVRRVRALVDRASASRGKPFRLAARVPFTFNLAFKLGFDVPTWIEEGLLDVVTAGTPRGHESDLSMREYVEFVGGRDLTLLGQIGLYHPAEQTRATALNYWKQGVDGIYLFNWYAPLWDRELWRKSLVEIGDPGLLKHRDKRYLIDEQVASLWRRSHPKAQLPLKIQQEKVGGAARVRFFVGDDLPEAAAAGKSVKAKLVMRLEQQMDDDDLQFRLNGVDLSREKEEVRREPTLFGSRDFLHLPFRADILKSGFNRLELVLKKRNPRLAVPLVLAQMSLEIDYGSKG